jgi:hypothetical protein
MTYSMLDALGSLSQLTMKPLTTHHDAEIKKADTCGGDPIYRDPPTFEGE